MKWRCGTLSYKTSIQLCIIVTSQILGFIHFIEIPRSIYNDGENVMTEESVALDANSMCNVLLIERTLIVHGIDR